VSIESVAACLNVQGLRPVTKLVLLGIANHDGDGGAWPAVQTLARYADVSERTVQRCLRELEQCGHITTIAQAGGSEFLSADRRPNRYLVHPVRDELSTGPSHAAG